MTKEIEQTQQSERFPRLEKIELGSSGWLSPAGVYFKTASTDHDAAAEWIINNKLTEIKRTSRRPVDELDLLERSGLDERNFLLKNRWILINGPIFRTNDALNYTIVQLTKLAEAKIPIVGAYDGAKEFSSEETVKWINSVVKDVSDFLDNQELFGWSGEKINQEEFWNDISRRGYATLEEFKKDPFHTEFEDTARLEFTEMRDVFSKGYQDEIVFDYEMETYTFRLIRLDSGERICVEHKFHHHERNSGNEDHLNIYVVDGFKFKKKIDEYLSTGSKVKIKGEYFSDLLGM